MSSLRLVVYTVEAGGNLREMILFAVCSSMQKALEEVKGHYYTGMSIQISRYTVDTQQNEPLAHRCSEGDAPWPHVGQNSCVGKWHNDVTGVITDNISSVDFLA